MRRRRFLTLALAAPLLVGPALARGGPPPWRVGTWKTAQTIAPYFYQHFTPEARVTVAPFTNPGDQKAALLAGSLDMAGTSLALAVAAAARGEPVRVVAALCNKCSALVVRRGSGITAVSGLRGKRIGYVPGTMHEILLRETLTRAGLDPARDVTLTRVDFFDMSQALAGGGLDAFLSGEPQPAKAVLDGIGEILAYPYFDDAVGQINAAMIVTAQTAGERAGLTAAMVGAHVRATKALMADRQLWLSQAARLTGTGLDVLKAASANMELAWDVDEVFVARTAALGARMAGLGLIPGEPDYAKLFDRRFVAAESGL